MSEIDQNFSDCVFEDENTIKFVGVEPTKDVFVKVGLLSLLGEDENSDERIIYTGFGADEEGKPSVIHYRKAKLDPETQKYITYGEEHIMMVKSFFKPKQGTGRRWWGDGGRNKRGRKSKKYSKTKSKSRTRRGGRRSRRVRQSRKVRKSRRRARS